MRKILFAGATVVVLGACAPVPGGQPSPTAPEPSPTAAPTATAPDTHDEPVSPSPSTVLTASDFVLSPAPARSDDEVARLVVTAGDVPQVDRSVGPAELGPDYTVRAQCAGAGTLEVAVLDATPGGAGDPVSKLEIPCGQDTANTFSTGETEPRDVELSIVGQEGDGLEGWVVVTNGVG